MRLKQLKLAGFKSFAEATTMRFPHALTAIVGPNGCGKSNVIDAIRWVMGESSAKQLRGGAMTDVIFAGSASKNAMSYASVELVFEHAEDSISAQLKNEYNLYHELSVRRQVSMEGRSDYFLNGTRCRKRDIVNLFLGTGLGARSYAVIEQGMISRLVDAKPLEMRTYVEEAAGVSKYQAKRAETAKHLAHAQDNLARLEDVREELEKQIRSLKRQANAAERYKALVDEKKALEKQVLQARLAKVFLQSIELKQKRASADSEFSQKREARLAAETESILKKKQLEAASEQFYEAQESWQTAQNDALKAAHAHLGSIQKLDSLHQEEDAALEQVTALTKTQDDDNALLTEIAAKLGELEPRLEEATSKLAAEQAALSRSEADALENQLNTLNREYQKLEASIHAASRSTDGLEKQRERILGRIQQLKNAQAELVSDAFDADIKALQDELALFMSNIASLDDKLHVNTNNLNTQQAEVDKLSSEQQQKSQVLARLEAELATLEKLQAQSQKQQQKSQKNEKNGKHAQASDQPRLVDALKLTETGKVYAELIEQYLADWLQAVVTHTPDQQPQAVRQLWLSDDDKNHQLYDNLTDHLPANTCLLSDWITAPKLDLFARTIVTDAVDFTLLDKLPNNVTILSKTGVCFGAGWMIDLTQNASSYAPISQQVRIDELQTQVASARAEVAAIGQKLKVAEGVVNELKTTANAAEKDKRRLAQAQSEASLKLTKLEAKAAGVAGEQMRLNQQRHQLESELLELDDEQAALLEEKGEASAKLADIAPRLSELQTELAAAKQAHAHKRDEIDTLQSQAHRLQLDKQHLDNQKHSLSAALSRTASQLTALKPRLNSIKTQKNALQASLNTLEEDERQTKREADSLKMAYEEAQAALKTVQAEQNELQSQRDALFASEESLRDAFNKLEIAFELAEQKQAQFTEQLEHIGASLTNNSQPLNEQNALDMVMSDASMAEKSSRLGEIDEALSKIGGVNLAAAEDLVELNARFDKLNAQVLDVEQSVAKLGSAIQQIDMETRGLFLATLRTVNDNLNQLFPKVFGGGQAQLTLEETTNWQSGVVLMAQPPGKKNSRLALLSGGEKALTALALVFSIFKLNPAPFCVLDEVDAPLDDANIARFCKLVTELATSVQFIFISHNKVSMQMANDLLGVTMPRAGVSALVSVSLDEASKFSVA